MDHAMRELLLDIFRAGLAAVDPAAAVERWLRETSVVQAGTGAGILVVGAGKASAHMASAAERMLGGRITDGLVIVKDGHGVPLTRIRLREAAHPVPDLRGQEATREMLGLLREGSEKSLVLCLLSGGGSALLVAPPEGITLSDKQVATDLLLRAGADIGELNTVRKHLSRVKGGGLARAACASPMITLVLSDVLGDRLDVIASGPTVPDGSTYQDAMDVLQKYGIRDKMPASVRVHLAKGMSGLAPETMKQGEPCHAYKQAVIIGSLRQALQAAKRTAEVSGMPAEIATSELQGEARVAARTLAAAALGARDAMRPGDRRCLLSGGETTVSVRGQGKGGRNQELALAFALQIEGSRGITLLSAGTDGTDGPTDAAGAVVDGATAGKARAVGLVPEEYLANNDSYTFFSRLDAVTGGLHHLKTGPTGTNVMDIQVILIES